MDRMVHFARGQQHRRRRGWNGPVDKEQWPKRPLGDPAHFLKLQSPFGRQPPQCLHPSAEDGILRRVGHVESGRVVQKRPEPLREIRTRFAQALVAEDLHRNHPPGTEKLYRRADPPVQHDDRARGVCLQVGSQVVYGAGMGGMPSRPG